MQHIDSSLQSASGSGWQLLGELELTVNPDTEPAVSKWLSVILGPLHLPVELVHRVLNSAQEAVLRALPAEAVMKFDHLHMLVFVPLEFVSKDGTWGFFRIEKIDTEVDKINPDHTVEFYLYLEGR